MARYRCSICGEIYDEDIEPVKFDELPDDWVCPVCHASKSDFVKLDDEPRSSTVASAESTMEEPSGADLSIDPKLVRKDGGQMDEIHAMALTGRSVGEPMDTLLPVPSFDDILFLGGQLAHPPLDDGEEVDISVTIGKRAAKPMVIETPVYVSHMSFGALSGRAKIALSKGSAMARTAMCSGEGGVLPDEADNAYKYIFEYVPNRYSVCMETFEKCDAVEIKIGQGTKPGMGGHLPGDKVTDIIAFMRGRPRGRDIQSPSRFPEINGPEDLRAMVDYLREETKGKPIGVKIAAGHIEEDLEFISGSGCDFITIDGRGGATGSSPKFLKDASTVPTLYALSRARRYMDAHGMSQELVITGGLRTSRDFIKALAMGADAVAVASAALMALGCQKYRACNGGRCPMGIATQDPELESRLDQEAGAMRVGNYLNATSEEIRVFLRVSGHRSLSELSLDDLCTVDSDIAAATGIRHARTASHARGAPAGCCSGRTANALSIRTECPSMRAAIGFIGAGKMAEALIGGLLSKGVFSKDDIVACAPSESTRAKISSRYGIEMYERAKEMCDNCDMVVIAVKPKHVAGLFEGEDVKIGDGRIVISIVAGLTMEKLSGYVPDAKIVRVMPNHCCMVLEGAMGYTCDAKMTPAEKEKVADILESVGLVAEVPESQMDAITGIAGSSPAFMYMVIDAMADAGVLNGLSREASIMLAAQSMLGAAKMVLDTGKHPDVLKDEVCSPAGTTIEGVRTLEDMGLRSAVISAIDATIEKSRQMSRQRRR
ncbi:MAG: pyrroline-5-carboxylate reductase [Candidatus Methanomethylophilaceae archaeon]|nr:pyrroline-5-carboxylate reductase [Candidatus Methanomethylophilaceae archaeon]